MFYDRITDQPVLSDVLILIICVLQSGFLGFHDPCIGEDKELYIRYEFRKLLHQVTYKEEEAMTLPQPG